MKSQGDGRWWAVFKGVPRGWTKRESYAKVTCIPDLPYTQPKIEPGWLEIVTLMDIWYQSRADWCQRVSNLMSHCYKWSPYTFFTFTWRTDFEMLMSVHAVHWVTIDVKFVTHSSFTRIFGIKRQFAWKLLSSIWFCVRPDDCCQRAVTRFDSCRFLCCVHWSFISGLTFTFKKSSLWKRTSATVNHIAEYTPFSASLK